MSLLCQRLAVLTDPSHTPLVRVVKGLEKESLRVTPGGTLAQTDHPQALGSALTHPRITTDYSEALLEFITAPTDSTAALLQELDNIQAFTYRQLNDELLWVASMPCMLGSDSEIPVARYGGSNVGQMKTIYRVGLGNRYGRLMQTIAGIHYNFSLPEEFWTFWYAREGGRESLQNYKSRRYFELIRNFRRNFWILLYLFGASPAVCRSFVKGRAHQLQPFGDDQHSMHLPYATSLRMGRLGYQSSAQDSLVVSYNDLESYLQTLCQAITGDDGTYAGTGVKNAEGEYQQLNTNLLQIENEFYSTIRPKRTAKIGQTALMALHDGGVEYIEVRCIDLNPYEPLGITAEQVNFLDAFLIYCLLADSPQTDCEKFRRAQENQRLIVERGRDPHMRLSSDAGEQSVTQWGHALLDDIMRTASLLDKSYGSSDFTSAVKAQRAKLENPELLPSARLLSDMAASDKTFFGMAMTLAEQHKARYAQVEPSAEWQAEMQAQVEASLQRQQTIEASDDVDFDTYLANYYAQYHYCGM